MARCISSAVAFTAGSILPIVAIVVLGARIPVTFAVVLLALALTGALSAYLRPRDGAQP